MSIASQQPPSPGRPRARRAGPRAALTLLAAVAAALACCADPGGAEQELPVWSVAFDTAGLGSLSGVWGSGPDDVFVVGGDEQRGVIHHYDGSSWASMEVPDGVPLLVWVFGFGPDEVFAVGLDGAAVRFDGQGWQVLETGAAGDLWGVWGSAPDDLWIVGSGDDGSPLAIHYDGERFEPRPLDAAANPRGVGALFKVWGIDGRVFAVGEGGLIVEWAGGRWVNRPAGVQANQDFVSLWGTSGSQIVVVGGRSNARIAEWDGTSFSTIAPSRMGGLNAVFVEEPEAALVGGLFGFVGLYDTRTDEVSQEPSPGSVDAVHAIWADGAGRAYAVGGSFEVPHRGLAWVRTIEGGDR